MTQLLLTSLALVSLIACGSDTPEDSPRTVDASSDTIRAAVKSNASVASKLDKLFAEQDGNLFYSPISIEAVSAVLLAGAAGNTASQLGEFLDAGDDPDVMHEGLGALLADLRRERSTYTLSLANRLWAEEGLQSSDSFEKTTRDVYDAPTEYADFANAPNAVRTDINKWVSTQTKGKIPELFRDGQITDLTVIAAVNAIYFKADWANAFDPKRTGSSAFHRADGTEVDVQMMMRPKSEARASQSENAVWLELPYKGKDISFLAYTHPRDLLDEPHISSVRELHDSLGELDLDEVVAQLDNVDDMVVYMPRFSLRSRIDLVPAFKALGVIDLFEPNLADLSNIDSTRRVVAVDPFVHEAIVQVDETGTVAAAATGAGGILLSGSPTVRLDRPFLFFIRDNLTGAILFSGQVADPSRED